MINLERYDFFDIGSSSGGAIDYAQNKFGWGDAIGIDLDEAKVNLAKISGLNVVHGDATRLDAIFEGSARCAIASHFLEHLPNINFAKDCLISAGKHITDTLIIQQPFFDFKEELAAVGLKFFWADWTGHKNMMTLQMWRKLLHELVHEERVYELGLLGVHKSVLESFDNSLIPLKAEKNSSAYDFNKHGFKPEVKLPNGLYREVRAILQKKKNEVSVNDYINKLNMNIDEVFIRTPLSPLGQDPSPKLDFPSDFRPMSGVDYFRVLSSFHKILMPKLYFEIGTNTGLSLRPSTCDSVAVDPNFQLKSDVVGNKSKLMLFQKTSDIFFEEDAPTLFVQSKIDLAFLDGMHLFEYLLRDFIHTEMYMAKKGVILLHDCVPPDVYVATRDRGSAFNNRSKKPSWWTGDVWKMVVILNRYRQDLTIEVYDSAPTGLVVIRNLDPNNNALSLSYDQICHEFMSISLEEYGFHKFRSECNILSSDRLDERIKC